MMRSLLALALLCSVSAANAQSVAPIAHWDMNGTVTDVTGNGHNGTPQNITPAAGADGIMGHGYYFNGSNSLVYIPASPDLNMTTGYSICARVKVQGFSSGACHANSIFVHGMLSPIGTGTYCLYFDDGPSGAGCGNPLDVNSQVFLTGACATGAGLASTGGLADFNYIPYIVTDTWYDVVVTFDDTAYRTYVNGVPMSVAYLATPGVPIGTLNEGASIGFDIFDSIGGYPYPFKGVIDDIMLFNYKLSDSAVDAYSNPSGVGVLGTIKPHDFNIYPNPANDMLYLERAKGTIVGIYNITGQKVTEITVTENKQPVDISNLPTGIYIARQTAADGSTVAKRFVKQ